MRPTIVILQMEFEIKSWRLKTCDSAGQKICPQSFSKNRINLERRYLCCHCRTRSPLSFGILKQHLSGTDNLGVDSCDLIPFDS